MGLIVLQRQQPLIIAVMLIARVPAKLFVKADGDAGHRRIEGQRIRLECEPSQGGFVAPAILGADVAAEQLYLRSCRDAQPMFPA